jgi:hypothetical protein
MDNSMMHLGVCEDCLAIHAVWSHPERGEPIPDPDSGEWETFGGCFVCDGRINWDETVPVTDYLKRGF